MSRAACLRDLRHELERARAGADHGDALAARASCSCVPRRRVEARGPRSARGPGCPGCFGRFSCPTALTIAFAASVSSPPPACGARTPSARRRRRSARADDLGAEADRARARRSWSAQRSKYARSSSRCEKNSRPVVVRLERVAVEVVRDVDAAARVAVLVPGAADAVVLLDHDVRDARPARGGSRRGGPTCPAPITSTWKRAGARPAARASQRRRARRRRRAPSPRASSARTRPGTCSPTRKLIISRTSRATGGGGSVQPRSR